MSELFKSVSPKEEPLLAGNFFPKNSGPASRADASKIKICYCKDSQKSIDTASSSIMSFIGEIGSHGGCDLP